MKAIFDNHLFAVIETEEDQILLEPVYGDEGQRITVSLSDETLIIDPTDDEISWAEYTRKLPKYNDLNPSPEPTALGAEKFGRIFEMAQQMQKEDRQSEENIPNFSPASVPEQWNAVELNGVCYTDDTHRYLEACEDHEAHFFSVYLHDVQGGVSCVADLPDRKSAEDLASLIRAMMPRFRDTGLLNG